MDITVLYSLFFLTIVYPADGIRNTVGHVPKAHRNTGRDVTSGHSRKKATLNEKMTATVSRTSVSDVELTNSVGNILTDDELEAIMPYLAKSTWIPMNSHNGFRKKGGHGGKGQHSLRKFGEKDTHERRKHFRVEGLDDILESHKGPKTSHKKHNLHRPHEKKNHPSPRREDVTGKRYNSHLTTLRVEEDNSSIFHRNHPRHNNHLPNVVGTVQPPTNRRHHRVHLSNSVAPPSRNHDNSVHLGRKTEGDIKIDVTDTSSDSVKVEENASKQSDLKSYDDAVDNWRRKATERILSSDTCECNNGGSCIMKVVCVCPPEYYGIRCQHKLHHHSCGDVKHGTWIRNGCNLCRCEDGNMLCVTSDIEGCAEEFDEKEEILEPETIDAEFDSYIDSSATNAEDKEDDGDYAGYDMSDILTLDYQMIPLPSSADCVTVIMPSLFVSVAIALLGAYIQV